MCRLLFLDVDGVLNRTGHPEDTGEIRPEKLALLKRITDVTQATIVLSSAWRRTAGGGAQHVFEVLRSAGIPAAFCGQTIELQRTDEKADDDINDIRALRAQEICSWLGFAAAGRRFEDHQEGVLQGIQLVDYRLLDGLVTCQEIGFSKFLEHYPVASQSIPVQFQGRDSFSWRYSNIFQVVWWPAQ